MSENESVSVNVKDHLIALLLFFPHMVPGLSWVDAPSSVGPANEEDMKEIYS